MSGGKVTYLFGTSPSFFLPPALYLLKGLLLLLRVVLIIVAEADDL